MSRGFLEAMAYVQGLARVRRRLDEVSQDELQLELLHRAMARTECAIMNMESALSSMRTKQARRCVEQEKIVAKIQASA